MEQILMLLKIPAYVLILIFFAVIVLYKDVKVLALVPYGIVRYVYFFNFYAAKGIDTTQSDQSYLTQQMLLADASAYGVIGFYILDLVLVIALLGWIGHKYKSIKEQ